MLHKTRGIVLHCFNYSDTYSIAQIYTEEFGRVSYLTAKSKGKKAKVPRSLFHALSVLDMEVEHMNLRDIHKLKEARSHFACYNVLMHPYKSAISIFLSEFISKITKDIQPNKTMFDFIYQSICILDLAEKGIANFHLVFMIRLTQFLGFYPDASDYVEGMYFDMQNGIFVKYKPLHPHFLQQADSHVFVLLLRMTYENMHTFAFSRHDRTNIIKKVLDYYRLHLSDFPDLKSLEVLHDVFE